MQTGTWLAIGVGLLTGWVVGVVVSLVASSGWAFFATIGTAIATMLATAWVYDQTCGHR